MSEANAHAFLEHVRRRPPLQKCIAALKGRSALRDLVTIAAQEGFEFSEEDYRAAIVTCSQGELSPESLDQLTRDMGMTP